MKYPENLLYTIDHEWIRFDGNQAFIGITDFAQQELGDIVYLDINTLDETVEKENVFGTIEAVKTVSDLFMPISGKVLEINSKIIDSSELVNNDPYGDGWIIKIHVIDQTEKLGLLNAEAYIKMIGK